MLFTRCPSCDTTFRITADALRKADGQVRCGRCACVFNAYTELHGGPGEAYGDDGVVQRLMAPRMEVPEPRSAEPTNSAEARIADEPVQAEPAAEAPARSPARLDAGASTKPLRGGDGPVVDAYARPPASLDADAGRVDEAPRRRTAAVGAASTSRADEEAFEGVTLASVIDELEASVVDDSSAAESAGPTESATAAKSVMGKHDALAAGRASAAESGTPAEAAKGETAARGKIVSQSETATGGVAAAESEATAGRTRAAESEAAEENETDARKVAPTWVVLDGEAPRHSSRRWAYGCIVAAALLALQVAHHYRAQLAASAALGPLVREAYAFVGRDVAPQWDLEQYAILDWTAIAEPNATGQGSLKIAARIYNRGPRSQPYPHVRVLLKDRWEATVGNRVFAPSEYLAASDVAHASMRAGRTARAELDIVDPGPDAYGFELDVCIPAEGGRLRCKTDEVFR